MHLQFRCSEKLFFWNVCIYCHGQCQNLDFPPWGTHVLEEDGFVDFTQKLVSKDTGFHFFLFLKGWGNPFQHTQRVTRVQKVFWEHTASLRTVNHNYKRTGLIRFHASWCKETRKISVASYFIPWNMALTGMPQNKVFQTHSYKQAISVLPHRVLVLNYWLRTGAVELSGRENMERGIFL